MRLLVINPNTSELVSDLIGKAARDAASEGTEVRMATAPFGSPSLESMVESTIAAHAVLTTLARDWRSNDAAIVAAFSDPGLAAAREISPIPIFGIAECAMKAAAAHGRAFSILTLGPQLENFIRSQADAYGVGRQLVSIEFLNTTIEELSKMQDALAGSVAELSHVAISKGAEAVVLGGGPFSGMGQRVAGSVAVAVIDGIVAAVHQAEQSHARRRDKRPLNVIATATNKAYQGLDPDLVMLMERMAILRGVSTS